jgi:hypothetical protein
MLNLDDLGLQSLSPQLKKQADATKAARIAREQALRTDARGPQSNEVRYLHSFALRFALVYGRL